MHYLLDKAENVVRFVHFKLDVAFPYLHPIYLTFIIEEQNLCRIVQLLSKAHVVLEELTELAGEFFDSGLKGLNTSSLSPVDYLFEFVLFFFHIF